MKSDIFSQKVWAKDCKYIVGKPGDVCYKCGNVHNLTADEAGANPFKAKKNANKQKGMDANRSRRS